MPRATLASLPLVYVHIWGGGGGGGATAAAPGKGVASPAGVLWAPAGARLPSAPVLVDASTPATLCCGSLLLLLLLLLRWLVEQPTP
jgi:hypothetical protein